MSAVPPVNGSDPACRPGTTIEYGREASVRRDPCGATTLSTYCGKDDQVDVKYHADGSATVTVNGEEHEFSAEEMKNLTIDTGCGDDNVTVHAEYGERPGLKIETGSGRDHVEFCEPPAKPPFCGPFDPPTDWIPPGEIPPSNPTLPDAPPVTITPAPTPLPPKPEPICGKPGGATSGEEATVTRSFSGNDITLTTRGNGNDSVDVRYNPDGSATVTVNGEEYEFSADEMKNLTINTGKGNDTVVVQQENSAGRNGLTINTGKGNDTVTGGDGNETINLGKGNDTVDSGGGDDTVDGGRGNDHIVTGDGNDTVKGGRGRDYIDAGDGNDTVNGGRGRDIIDLGLGYDTVKRGFFDRVTDPDAA